MANDELQQVLEEIKGLRKDLTGDLKKRAERLETILKLLEPIRLHVKHVATAFDDQGNPIVKVLYESEVQEVHFYPNDEPVIDKFITSANMLNLVTYSDMEKIHSAIKIAESKKQY